MEKPRDHYHSVYDVVGIGFGPSNLALAIALEEHNEKGLPGQAVTAVFLEKQQQFGWHRGMLIDGATMQVSFLKDLVTLRNPASRFGFVSYLHERGRLVDFINHKTYFPTREEFHDYLTWASAGVDHLVQYGTTVTGIRPVLDDDGQVDFLEVVARRSDTLQETVVHRARNIVFAVGLTPRLPDGVTASERIWHSDETLHKLAHLPSADPKRFVVVGAGQSAAEAVEYLHRTYPQAEVSGILARYGYSPADDSPYANRIFDPEAVDMYFGADEAVKEGLMNYHRNTNYSVVDLDLIEDLYGRAYQEKVRGEERLRILGTSRVTGVQDGPGGVLVSIHHLPSNTTDEMLADAVVFGTGYDAPDPGALLGEADRYCHRDATGRLVLGRDYRVSTDAALRTGIYLQGGTEHSHGITSSLLSMAAVRAGEILDSVVERRTPKAEHQHVADVVVVGAGVLGAAIFHELADRGVDVTLVERDLAGLGTTASSGGIVRCYHDDPELVDRAIHGWRFYQEFASRTGEEVLFHESGFLYLPDVERVEYARKEAERIAAAAPAEWLEPGDLERRFGRLLHDCAHGAVWEPRAGYLDPTDVTQGYLRAGRRKGGRLLEGLEVRALLESGGRVRGVHTSTGVVRANTVVLATGAATPQLLSSWGIDHDLWAQAIQVDLRLPAEPVDGHPAYMDDVYDINGRPDPESTGLFLGHPTDQRLPASVEPCPVDQVQSRTAVEAGERRLRWVRDSQGIGTSRAAECYSPDGLGHVARLPGLPEVLLATGFNGGGFKMAPWAASEITRLISPGQ